MSAVRATSTSPDHRLDGFRRRWTAAFLFGELVGFVPPAMTGVVLGGAHVSDPTMVAGLTVAGLLEGAAIGGAQARVLARSAPEIDGRDWMIATTAAAGFAWFVGMGGGALMGSSAGSPLLLIGLVPAWSAALMSMGYLQWRVLRRSVDRSARWVPVTAGAWLVGVMIPVVALSAAPNGWPGWAHGVVGLVAAVAMGCTVGALTGRTLERLLSDPSPS